MKSLKEIYIDGFKNSLNFSGCTSRRDFWIFMILPFLCVILLFFTSRLVLEMNHVHVVASAKQSPPHYQKQDTQDEHDYNHPWSTGPTASYDVPTPVGEDGPIDSVKDIEEGKGLYPTTTEGLTAGFREDFDEPFDILGDAWRGVNELFLTTSDFLLGKDIAADINGYMHTVKMNKYDDIMIQKYVPNQDQTLLGSHFLYSVTLGMVFFFADMPILKIPEKSENFNGYTMMANILSMLLVS